MSDGSVHVSVGDGDGCDGRYRRTKLIIRCPEFKMMNDILFYLFAVVLLATVGRASCTRTCDGLSNIMDRFCSGIAFHSRARVINTIHASKYKYQKLHSLATGDDSYSQEVKTDGSLRNSIHHLASIIDPNFTPISEYPSIQSSQYQYSSHNSTVHIIGTGVSPTLLTLPLSTLFILSQADVVLYDSLGLSYNDIQRVAPKHCEIVCVGKRGDQKSWKQGDIDQILIEKATASSVMDSEGAQKRTTSIVRLKGGDPFLFGRTRTEIDALRANNIPYTYTPGISSCIAGPHLGGIPLTDTSLDCQSFGVWSGTDAMGRYRSVDSVGNDRSKFWQDMDVDVLVFLMIGRLDKLEALCQTIAHDCNDSNAPGKWNNDTPCAVIQNAGGLKVAIDKPTGLPVQRVWRSTLGKIVGDIMKEDINRKSVSPAVFVVGATATLDLLSQ